MKPYRLGMTIGIDVMPVPTFGEGPTVRKLNRHRHFWHGDFLRSGNDMGWRKAP